MKRFVLEGDAVDELVVVARVAGHARRRRRRARSSCPSPTLDVDAGARARRAAAASRTSTSTASRVAADRVLGDPGPVDRARRCARALEEATVALALEMVGTAQTIFDITLEYAKQREQFGVPIGSFQAIKHKFADMLIALERARATGYFAALTIAEDDDRRTTRDVDRQGRGGRLPAAARARRASRSTAASATRGSTTCTSTCGA